MTRLLVTGSRIWTDALAIERAVLQYADLEVVIEGEATGADTIARRVTERMGVPVLRFQAAWNIHAPGWCRCSRPGLHCPAAGPRRNRRMIDEGLPTRVVAFTDGFQNPRSGTRHMCRMAVKAGLPVTLVEHEGDGCRLRELTIADFGVARV